MNITLDDTSPQLRFQSAGVEWYTEHGSGQLLDTGWEECYAQTFSTTNITGASMSLKFNGIAVYVYGTRWANHGLYEVVLDDSVKFFDGTTPDNGRLFQQCLYAATGLSDAPHTLTITNTPNLNPRTGKIWLDIDYVVITAAAPADEIYTTRLDYDSPAWTFVDGYGTGWTPQPSSSSSYTYSNNASAQLDFTGNSVQVFGGVGPEHGNYTVWIDGQRIIAQGTKAPFNGSYAIVVQQTTLVVVSGLEDGDHTLLIENVKTDQGANLDIAYAIVNSSNPSSSDETGTPMSSVSDSGFGTVAQMSETAMVQSVTGTSIRSGAIVTASSSVSMATIPVKIGGGSGPTTANANSSSSTGTTHDTASSTSKIGAIVGGTLGAVVLLVILAVCCVCATRRRRQRRERRDGHVPLDTPVEKVSGWLSSIRREPEGDSASVSQYSVFRSLFIPYPSPSHVQPTGEPAGLIRTHTDLPPLDIPRSPTRSSAPLVQRYTWNPPLLQIPQSRFSPESTSQSVLNASGLLATTTTTAPINPEAGASIIGPGADPSPQDTSPSSTLKTDILNLPYRPRASMASTATGATGRTGWWSQTTLSVFGRERDAGPALPPNYQQATQKKRSKPSPV